MPHPTPPMNTCTCRQPPRSMSFICKFTWMLIHAPTPPHPPMSTKHYGHLKAVVQLQPKANFDKFPGPYSTATHSVPLDPIDFILWYGVGHADYTQHSKSLLTGKGRLCTSWKYERCLDSLVGGFNHLEKYEFVNGKDYPMHYGK